MKTFFTLLLALSFISLTCISCFGSDDEDPIFEEPDPVLGCLEENALNFNSQADTDDGSCRYSKATFYARFNLFNGVPIVNIDISLNGEAIGSIPNGFIWPNGPGNCSSSGTVPYQFQDASVVDWNATLFLSNGQTISTGGTRAANSSAECIKINVTI